MAIAEKIGQSINKASWIRKMFEEGVLMKQKYGAESVYDFSLGNPNVEPPEHFKKLLRTVAAQEVPNKHGYMPNAGMPEARVAVAAQLNRQQDSPMLTAEHVIMTCGAAGGLNVVLKTLLNPGEEVIIPKPLFAEYPFYVDNHGGVSTLVSTRPDFFLDVDAIASAINERTKVILINSPNNPSGRVYDETSIQGLASIIEEKSSALKRDIYLASDEPYREIVYDGVKVPSILKACKNGIVVSSYSKSLSLPGERIGYIAVHPELPDLDAALGGMVLCNRILGFVNAPALMQRIVKDLQGVQVDVAEYKRKRDLIYDGLIAMGYEATRPEGAFYLFPKSPIADDVAFVRALQKRRILTTPGSGFGVPGYFRIAYCVDDATIVNAMNGFEETLREFKK
ncbi:MAG: pyridoxal phosphate-dependent aminotransferase [Deltaproteobacteria bacterium]|nr:pyridoxal phosphate-dependent aminotransferase [Deltaproteobacteria bacterium]